MKPTVQQWRKLGRLFVPDGNIDWMATHASVPIAEPLADGRLRIYFSSRDRDNRSFTGSITVDPQRLTDSPVVDEMPVLIPGALGEFDDSGAMASWLTHWEGRSHLYYIGWNLGRTVPFRNSIGLAVAEHDGTFRRYCPGPIVDRTMHEPHFVASCCVIPDHDKWRMWYLSCTGWQIRPTGPEHRYHIKYAESVDGIHWQRDGIVAIDYANDDEYAISRPSVLRIGDIWHMWYSYRGSHYRIGYARSNDGKRWTRHDDCVALPPSPSPSEWDAEMVEYPHVFWLGGKLHMLYNGDRYGMTGLGLAVLDTPL